MQDPIKPDQVRSDEARSDKAKPDEARSNKARSDKARPDKARPDEARPNEARLDETVEAKPIQEVLFHLKKKVKLHKKHLPYSQFEISEPNKEPVQKKEVVVYSKKESRLRKKAPTKF
ncbi:5293_t:CDS:2, partial [Gigaspora margarita]